MDNAYFLFSQLPLNFHFRNLFHLKNYNGDVEDLALTFTVVSNELELKVRVKLELVVFRRSVKAKELDFTSNLNLYLS